MHSIRASQYENSAYLRYAITYGRYAASRNSAAKGSAQSAPVFRHARFVAQSEWRLAPSATSRLSIRCWTSSRSSTVSELMSSLRRRPQINRALHWPNANHLHATLRATFHRRRVRPTRATTTGRRTACSSWLARSRASTGADLREVGRHNAICASSGHHQLNGAARCVVDTI